MGKHPLNKGRLIYDHRNHQILEVSSRYLDVDSDIWRYKLSDGSHTAYEEANEIMFSDRYRTLPITVHNNLKSEYLLNYEDLVENLQGMWGFENLDSNSFSKQNAQTEENA